MHSDGKWEAHAMSLEKVALYHASGVCVGKDLSYRVRIWSPDTRGKRVIIPLYRSLPFVHILFFPSSNEEPPFTSDCNMLLHTLHSNVCRHVSGFNIHAIAFSAANVPWYQRWRGLHSVSCIFVKFITKRGLTHQRFELRRC